MLEFDGQSSLGGAVAITLTPPPSRHFHHRPLPLLKAARPVSEWTVFLRCQISSAKWTYRVFVLWPETEEVQRKTPTTDEAFELTQQRQCRFFFSVNPPPPPPPLQKKGGKLFSKKRKVKKKGKKRNSA